MSHPGKRAADRESTPLPRIAFAFGGGSILALALWGYLVWSAIHFGTRARAGHGSEWALAVAMTFGAVAALFVCIVLATRAITTIGLLPTPAAADAERHAGTHRPPGGKRAAR